jgi:hypothetical protein
MARCRAARRSRCRSESQRPRSIRLPSRIRRADRKRQIRSSRGSAPMAVPITGPPLRMPRMTTSDHLVAALDDHGSAAKPASTCFSRKKRLTSGGQRDVIVAPNRSVDRVLTRSILAHTTRSSTTSAESHLPTHEYHRPVSSPMSPPGTLERRRRLEKGSQAETMPDWRTRVDRATEAVIEGSPDLRTRSRLPRLNEPLRHLVSGVRARGLICCPAVCDPSGARERSITCQHRDKGCGSV